jgi:putative sigma-54 modulation protein
LTGHSGPRRQARSGKEVIAVDINIHAKNIDLNPAAEDYIQKKFNRIQRHLRNIGDAKVEVSRTSARSSGNRVQAQMTLNVGGYTLRGQDSGVNLFAAIDGVTDIVDRQVRRFKGKVYHTSQAKKSGRGFRDIPVEAIIETSDSVDAEEAMEDIGEVVRTKRFAMTPMSIEDAILQMEMLDHTFFLFFNIDTDEYNVAYRRQDGDYGVIEPELI